MSDIDVNRYSSRGNAAAGTVTRPLTSAAASGPTAAIGGPISAVTVSTTPVTVSVIRPAVPIAVVMPSIAGPVPQTVSISVASGPASPARAAGTPEFLLRPKHARVFQTFSAG